MRRYVVDRIEENRFLVCEAEDGSQVILETNAVRGPVREGDCLVEEDGVLSVDEPETRRRRESLRALQKKLFGR